MKGGIFELGKKLATVRGEVEGTDLVDVADEDVARAVVLHLDLDIIESVAAKTSLHSELASEEMLLELGDLGTDITVLILPLVARSLSSVDANCGRSQYVSVASICGSLCTRSVRAVVVWNWRGVAVIASLALCLVLVLGSADVVLFRSDLLGGGQGSFHLSAVEGGGGSILE